MECTKGFFWVPFYFYICTKLTGFILKNFPFEFLENTDSALEFADDELCKIPKKQLFFLALKLLSISKMYKNNLNLLTVFHGSTVRELLTKIS